CVWMTWMYWQTGTFFYSRDNFIDIGEIQVWRNTLGIHVQCDCCQIDVTGTLTVPKHTTFNTIGTGHNRQFRSGNAATTVIMTVHRNNYTVTTLNVTVHPFDLIGIDVWT